MDIVLVVKQWGIISEWNCLMVIHFENAKSKRLHLIRSTLNLKLTLDAVLVFLEKPIFDDQLWCVQFLLPNLPMTFGNKRSLLDKKVHLSEMYVHCLL